MIRFRMIKISIPQFAIICQKAEDSYQIETTTSMSHTEDGSAVAVDMTFSFTSSGENAIILQIRCEFGIHPEDLTTLTAENKITIPKDALDSFVAQTVGTARGVLHCKTEGTPFNGIIIPPLDVSNILQSDMIIQL